MANKMSQGVSGGQIVPSNYHSGMIERLTPEQKKIRQYMYDLIGPEGYLSKISAGDEDFFRKMEAPALRQNQAISSGATSRFGNLGLGSAKSGGFGMPTSSFKDFAKALQANRTQQSMNATNSLMTGSNAFLSNKPYERFLTPDVDDFKGSKLPSTIFGAGGGAIQGGMMGGWPGAILGGAYGAFQGYSSQK